MLMLDREAAGRKMEIEKHPASLGRKETCPCMSGHDESRQPFVVCQVETQGSTVDLRVLPRNRKGERRVKEDVEVVGVIRPLDEVVHVQKQMSTERLLKARVDLGTRARPQRQITSVAQNAVGQSAGAGHARKNQILIVWTFETAHERGTQDRAGALEVVRDTQSRLQEFPLGNPIVVVEPNTQRHRRLTKRQDVLCIESFLLDIRVAAESKLLAAARQIEWQEAGQKVWAGRIVESGIGDSELERLGQEGVGKLHAEFGVMYSLYVRQVSFHSHVI